MSAMGKAVRDSLKRPLRDLRISVTDRCNFRCSYCMPRDVFDGDWPFLPKDMMLSYEEMVDVAKAAVELGVSKIRLTGGEPLLRKDIASLVQMLRQAIPDVELAMTTNGSLLSRHAASLTAAGLDRITVSLDALDPDLFQRLSDSTTNVDDVLTGIEAALAAGLTPLKLNCVVRRGLNEDQIIEIVERFKGRDIVIRFIEFMDVGNTNSWRLKDVVTSEEIFNILSAYYDLLPVVSTDDTGVARLWEDSQSGQRIGIISSISDPFCGDCCRVRLSADGRLFTCLFSSAGHDLRGVLRSGGDLRAAIDGIWIRRDDRFSEERSESTHDKLKVEMSYLGG